MSDLPALGFVDFTATPHVHDRAQYNNQQGNMSVDHCGKQYCIIDTGALVNLCRLELGARRAIQWVLDDFCVLIPQLIFNEGRPYVSRTDHDERKLYFSDVLGLVRAVNAACEIVIDEQISHLAPPMRIRIDAGEKNAAAFAFEISRESRQYVVLVTNDFKATEPLEQVFSDVQIGILKDAYDILMFIASRHPDEVPPKILEIALRDLNAMVREPNADPEEPSKPDQVLAKHLQRLHRFPDAFAAI